MRYLGAALFVIAITAITYVACAFALLDWRPDHWPQDTRTVLALIVSGAAFCALLAALPDPKDRR